MSQPSRREEQKVNMPWKSLQECGGSNKHAHTDTCLSFSLRVPAHPREGYWSVNQDQDWLAVRPERKSWPARACEFWLLWGNEHTRRVSEGNNSLGFWTSNRKTKATLSLYWFQMESIATIAFNSVFTGMQWCWVLLFILLKFCYFKEHTIHMKGWKRLL